MSAGDMCQPPTQMESKAPKEVLGKNVCACGECEGGGGAGRRDASHKH